MNNVKFSLLVACIFAWLYEYHPEYQTLDSSSFDKFFFDYDQSSDKDVHDHVFDFGEYFEDTVRWLEEEGYIRRYSDLDKFVLTSNFLEKLNLVSDSTDDQQTIGQKLIKAIKDNSPDLTIKLVTSLITLLVKGN